MAKLYYKKFEHYILLCFIKQITMVTFEGEMPKDNQETKSLISADQLQFLAESICFDLVLYTHVDTDTCKKNFWVPDLKTPKSSPPLKIRCQTEYSIRFYIEPTDRIQLVMLVPLLANDSASDMEFINYSLVEANTEYWDISTTPQRNYTLWTTVLDRGVPLKWRGGEKVPLYSKSMQPEERRYDIKDRFIVNEDNRTLLHALFNWNTSGVVDILKTSTTIPVIFDNTPLYDVDGDVCFDVVNSCNKTDFNTRKLYDYIGDWIQFDNLLVDDNCYLQVTGLYGTTNFNYRTPACDYNCSSTTKPEFPKIEAIMAYEDAFGTWEVHVNWSAPTLRPDQYNVTLRTDTIETVVLPGDATEAVFSKVVGTGIYNVSVYAIIGDMPAAHTSGRAIFPGQQAGGGGGAAGALAGCCAAAALALLCRWRRAARHAALPPYKPGDLPSKDSEAEVLEVCSDMEDRWEVRIDKLVLHEVIGEGAFGVVRRATLAPNSVQVAVKMLKDFPSLEEIRSFRSEMELMKSVGVHPHLVSLVGCCSGRRPLIIAEYCSRGDLLSYLRCTWDVMLSKRNVKYYNNNIDVSDYRNDLFKCKVQMENSKLVVNKLYELQDICDKELTALDLLSFCRQIAMGMEFLAANRVVHRDLAARNVLVTSDRTLKIADFGLSRDVYEENQYKQKGNGKMPVKWMALESLTRKIYTTQSDVWSFGVVVWEIATVGGAPYASVAGARLSRLLRAGYRMPRPNNCSPLLYDIMLSCWRTHPRDRPTFAELHQRLDELLNSACANQYLTLEIDTDDAPPTPKHHRYIKMLIRGKRNWARGENYERPLKAPHTNHYTSPPDSTTTLPV